MYSNNEAWIKTDRLGKYFKIQKGVRQEDPLSSTFFVCVLEEIFRGLNWEDKEICINGEYLSNLRFADDVVLIEEDPDKMKTMVEELEIKSREAGLEMNVIKTKKLQVSEVNANLVNEEKIQLKK